MGAWGTGIWENDDAMDWAGDLRDSAEPASFALEAFATVAEAMREEAHVELDVASAAIAAAAWLASAVGGPALPADDDMPAAGPVSAAQAAAALAAVALATGESSEWRELWDEAGSTREALGQHTDVIRALRAVAGV